MQFDASLASVSELFFSWFFSASQNNFISKNNADADCNNSIWSQIDSFIIKKYFIFINIIYLNQNQSSLILAVIDI